MDDELPTLNSLTQGHLPARSSAGAGFAIQRRGRSSGHRRLTATITVQYQRPSRPDGLLVTRTIKRETFRMFNRDSLVSTGRERANPPAARTRLQEASDNDCCVAPTKSPTIG